MIIHRLMKKLDDGHYEVVGYQKFENGRIYHQAVDSNNWHDISLIGESNVNLVIEGLTKLPFYIEHNRLDRYTGVDLKDGTKVFERDKIILQAESMRGIISGFIVWDEDSLSWHVKDGGMVSTILQAYDIKVIGILGVGDRGEEGHYLRAHNLEVDGVKDGGEG